MIITNRHLLLIATIVTLCGISFVHIFLFPVYGSPKQIVSVTVLVSEQSLCMDKLRQTQTTHWRRCPQGGVVTVRQGGRLCNQMWEYASVLAVALHTGLEPYVPRCIRVTLDEVFEQLTVPTFDEIAHCSLNLDASIMLLPNKSIVLPQYVFLPELVLSRKTDFLDEFTFGKQLRENSHQVLTDAARLRNGSRVFVGVHVRRTDYQAFMWRKYRATLADPTFFLTAMEYFEAKYQSVVFVVVSDDTEWCVRHLTKKKKNVYVSSKGSMNSPGQDLSIMAACNHSIIDYGTYGVSGAILAGGETIFYGRYNFAHRVSRLLPNWHMLE